MKQILTNDENLIKEYSVFKGKMSTCFISVTNKRLIMTQSKQSFFNKMEYSKEIDINEVNSISTKYCKRISVVGMIFVLIVASVLFALLKSKLVIGMTCSFAVLVIGFVLLNVFAPKAGTLLISTSTAECVRIGLSMDLNRRNSKRFTMLNVKLGKDFTSLCEELGAIIKAVQAGDKNVMSFLQ